MQRHVGELAAHLDAALLVLADAAAALGRRPTWPSAASSPTGPSTSPPRSGLEVTSKVIQIVGGRGAYKDFPPERAFRDVRTSTLMPPTMDRMLEAIGKSALGLEGGMFKVSGQ